MTCPWWVRKYRRRFPMVNIDYSVRILPEVRGRIDSGHHAQAAQGARFARKVKNSAEQKLAAAIDGDIISVLRFRSSFFILRGPR